MGFHGESCSMKPKFLQGEMFKVENPPRDTVAGFRFELTLTRLRVQD